QIIQFLDRLRRAVGFDLVFEAAYLDRSRRQNEVLRTYSAYNIGRRQPFGLQRGKIKVHLDLALFPAVGVGNADSIDRDQLRADEVQSKVVELLFGEPLPGKAEL